MVEYCVFWCSEIILNNCVFLYVCKVICHCRTTIKFHNPIQDFVWDIIIYLFFSNTDLHRNPVSSFLSTTLTWIRNWCFTLCLHLFSHFNEKCYGKIYTSINEYLIQEIKSFRPCIEQTSINSNASSPCTKIDNFCPFELFRFPSLPRKVREYASTVL